MSSRSPDLPGAFLGAPIAHRGLHDRACGVIENSRGAIRAAIEAGYGIEIDIQPAACGEAMVFHDDTLDRLTAETGAVRERSAEALGRIALTASGGETIPTLGEILALVDGRAPLLIEIKDQDGALGPDVGPLGDRIAELLVEYAGPVPVMSFNPAALASLVEAAPRIPRGLITCDFTAEHWPRVPAERRAALAALRDLEPLGAAFISHQWRDLSSPAVLAAKAAGRAVLCWTVRSPREERIARALADNVTFEGYLAEVPEDAPGQSAPSPAPDPRPGGPGWRRRPHRQPAGPRGH